MNANVVTALATCHSRFVPVLPEKTLGKAGFRTVHRRAGIIGCNTRTNQGRYNRFEFSHRSPSLLLVTVPVDKPKLLGDFQARIDRRTQLHESHIAPLTAFVEALRHEVGSAAAIPDFDPWDGGIDAEILYLLETPGPRAVASGFVSRNNPDESAKNFFELNAEAKIPRRRTVTWNVVPWYLGDGNRIRAAKRIDLEQGIHFLSKLLSLLPKLRAVVFVGRKAEHARETVIEQLPNARLFYCPHPSPQCLNTNPANRRRIIDGLREVATATSDELRVS